MNGTERLFESERRMRSNLYTSDPQGRLKRVAVAYYDREREAQFNPERLEMQKQYMTKCSYASFIAYCISTYQTRQQYTHCEILFEEYGVRDDKTSLAFGVFSDSGVKKMDRRFANPAYKYLFFDVREEEYSKALIFCNLQVNKSYDTAGASWRMMVMPPESDESRWWCASFVHAALQHMGILKYYRVNTLNVDDIVSLASKSAKIVESGLTNYQIGQSSKQFSADMFDARAATNNNNKKKKKARLRDFNPCKSEKES